MPPDTARAPLRAPPSDRPRRHVGADAAAEPVDRSARQLDQLPETGRRPVRPGSPRRPPRPPGSAPPGAGACAAAAETCATVGGEQRLPQPRVVVVAAGRAPPAWSARRRSPGGSAARPRAGPARQDRATASSSSVTPPAWVRAISPTASTRAGAVTAVCTAGADREPAEPAGRGEVAPDAVRVAANLPDEVVEPRGERPAQHRAGERHRHVVRVCPVRRGMPEPQRRLHRAGPVHQDDPPAGHAAAPRSARRAPTGPPPVPANAVAASASRSSRSRSPATTRVPGRVNHSEWKTVTSSTSSRRPSRGRRTSGGPTGCRHRTGRRAAPRRRAGRGWPSPSAARSTSSSRTRAHVVRVEPRGTHRLGEQLHRRAQPLHRHLHARPGTCPSPARSPARCRALSMASAYAVASRCAVPSSRALASTPPSPSLPTGSRPAPRRRAAAVATARFCPGRCAATTSAAGDRPGGPPWGSGTGGRCPAPDGRDQSHSTGLLRQVGQGHPVVGARARSAAISAICSAVTASQPGSRSAARAGSPNCVA